MGGAYYPLAVGVWVVVGIPSLVPILGHFTLIIGSVVGYAPHAFGLLPH